MVGTFNYQDKDYQINVSDRSIKTFNNEHYYLTISGVGQIVRQVLNQMKQDKKVHFDKIYISTKYYVGGNSLTCNVVGGYDDDYEIIKQFINHIQGGWFNGMIDLYEYDNIHPQFKTKDQSFDVEVKYSFCHQGFPYGTKGYFENRMYNERRN
tara:strand:- start:385 stop:843 length:459 start_codon:yes stop_codon:yes gene_type:complete